MKKIALLIGSCFALPASALQSVDGVPTPAVVNKIDAAKVAPRSSLVDSLLEKAAYWHANGRDDLAANTWDRVLQSNPNQPEALAGLAAYHASVGHVLQSKDFLSRLKQVNPKHSAVLSSDGELASKEKRVDSAAKASDLAAKMAKNKGKLEAAYFSELKAGYKAREDNQLDEAEKHFKVAVSILPNMPEASTALADADFEKDDLASAAHKYQSVLHQFPRYPDATLGLARVLVKQAKYDGALSLLEKLDTNSSNEAAIVELRAELHLRMGESAEKAGNNSAALNHFNQAKLLSPNNPWVSLAWSRLTLREGNPDAAESEMQSLLARAPSTDASFASALLYMDLKKSDEALALLDAIPSYKRTNQIVYWQETLTSHKRDENAHLASAEDQKENSLASIASKMEDKEHAEAVQLQTKQSQRVNQLLPEIYAAYDAQDYKQSHLLLLELESLGGAGRNSNMLHGWVEMNLGLYNEAAKHFSALYQESPDKESAEGLFYSYSNLNRSGELTSMVREENLKQLLSTSHANSGGTEDEIIANRRVNRAFYGQFENLGISQADISFSQRSKVGIEGTSRLVTRREPSVGYGWISDDNKTDYRVQLDRLRLNSGTLDFAGLGVMVGSDGAYPQANGVLPLTFATQGTARNLFEPVVTARRDTAQAVYTGEVGLTPMGADLAPTLVGRLNALKYTNWGAAGVEFYIQPVRDSILSYVGMVDPFLALPAWGRVTKTGISPSVNFDITNKWLFNASANYERLEGVNTKANHHIVAKAGIAYKVDASLFDYFTMSLNGSYEHYQTNQNLFSFGNGGYYSPQASTNIGPSVNFMTHHFKPLITQGSVGVSYGHATAETAVRFPLDPANVANVVAPGAVFYGGNTTGLTYNLALQSLWNVSKDLQLGAAFTYLKSDALAVVAGTPTFKENYLNFFARIPLK